MNPIRPAPITCDFVESLSLTLSDCVSCDNSSELASTIEQLEYSVAGLSIHQSSETTHHIEKNTTLESLKERKAALERQIKHIESLSHHILGQGDLCLCQTLSCLAPPLAGSGIVCLLSPSAALSALITIPSALCAITALGLTCYQGFSTCASLQRIHIIRDLLQRELTICNQRIEKEIHTKDCTLLKI